MAVFIQTGSVSMVSAERTVTMESICESCINYRQELIERGLCRAQDLYNHFCEIESQNFWTEDGCASYKPREDGDA